MSKVAKVWIFFGTPNVILSFLVCRVFLGLLFQCLLDIIVREGANLYCGHNMERDVLYYGVASILLAVAQHQKKLNLLIFFPLSFLFLPYLERLGLFCYIAALHSLLGYSIYRHFREEGHSVWKSHKMSHFSLLRAKRAKDFFWFFAPKI